MHISDTQINKVFAQHLHKVYMPGIASGMSMRRPDQLTLSRQAEEMQNIRQFVANLPDVRQDKVSEFRSMIEQGIYNPTDFEIASAMIDSAVSR